MASGARLACENGREGRRSRGETAAGGHAPRVALDVGGGTGTFVAAALRARPERTLALFGHADLFHLLMERHCGRDDKWLKNAEVLRVELR